MKTRILTGIVAFLVFLPFLIFSETVAFPIAMLICAVISTFEMMRCLGVHKNLWLTLPLYAAAAASPLMMRLVGAESYLPVAVAVILLLMLYTLSVTVFSHGKLNILQSSAALTIGLYIIAGFTAMVYLHDFHEGGKYLYLLSFIGAWVTDSFAYFSGRLFGRHKLIPDVSPKKTVEGSIGGMLFCVAAFVGFAFLYNALWRGEGTALPVWLMAVIGLLTSIVSQVGDLAMSVIKRQFGIKDYGKIFPGHGGFLDRFDSVLAVAVVLAVAFGIATGFAIL